MYPPEFKILANPIDARTWLKKMEKAFALTRIIEDQKTEYANYFLKGDTNYWWESKRALEREAILSWERITELFLEKYFLRYMQHHMELKFLEFKKHNLSVADYEVKFTELSRFVPKYVNTYGKRSKWFQHHGSEVRLIFLS